MVPCPCAPYGSGVSNEKKKERKKENDDFQILFLDFYKAELKSDGILYIQNISTTTIPTYVEITTAISDACIIIIYTKYHYVYICR